MNDSIIEQIRRYAESLERRYLRLTRKEFEENSWAVYAAYEILNDILNHPMIPADITVVTFFFRMQNYLFEASSSKTRRMFKIAMDTADTIQAMI